MKRNLEHFYGCLIGGAIGDALGAPIEFLKYEKIISKYGEEGLTHLVIPEGEKKAWITDDTQLTLFTAEGLIRGVAREKHKNIIRNERDTTILIFRAYLRWLYTQGLKTPNWQSKSYDGWLIRLKRLHAYREPGVTCITTLGKGIMGTELAPINDSKGCGCIVRVAPIGLFEEEVEQAFRVASHVAAISHGHPTAYLAAGTKGALIHYLIKGLSLEEAVAQAISLLKTKPSHEECSTLLEKAVAFAKEGNPSVEKIHALGDGMLAEEALAIGIYAALSYQEDFIKAVLLATNHSGDSDSTGAITGNILGAYLGASKLSADWIEQVELASEIHQLAEDLLMGYEDTEEWQKKYPAW